MKYWYQCRFEQDTPDGIAMATGWIESDKNKKFVTVGSLVELKGEPGFWRVVTMADTGIGHDEYMRITKHARTKFASLNDDDTNIVPFKKGE